MKRDYLPIILLFIITENAAPVKCLSAFFTKQPQLFCLPWGGEDKSADGEKNRSPVKRLLSAFLFLFAILLPGCIGLRGGGIFGLRAGLRSRLFAVPNCVADRGDAPDRAERNTDDKIGHVFDRNFRIPQENVRAEQRLQKRDQRFNLARRIPLSL